VRVTEEFWLVQPVGWTRCSTWPAPAFQHWQPTRAAAAVFPWQCDDFHKRAAYAGADSRPKLTMAFVETCGSPLMTRPLVLVLTVLSVVVGCSKAGPNPGWWLS
jgi:hypothetical protein